MPRFAARALQDCATKRNSALTARDRALHDLRHISLHDEWSELIKTLAQPSVVPLFIVGCGRSGTTAFRNALQTHSSVLVANLCPLLQYFGKTAFKFGVDDTRHHYQRYTALRPLALRERFQKLVLESIWEDHAYLAYAKTKFGYGTTSWNPDVLKLWATKCFLDEDSVQGVSWMFPGARFVMIERNGIDVVSSMAQFKAFREWTFDKQCGYWAENIFRYASSKHGENFLVVPFERFLDDPKDVFAQVFSFAGLPHEVDPERFAASWHVHPLDKTTAPGSAKAAIRARPPAYESWGTAQRATFKAICGDAMTIAGYDIPF